MLLFICLYSNDVKVLWTLYYYSKFTSDVHFLFRVMPVFYLWKGKLPIKLSILLLNNTCQNLQVFDITKDFELERSNIQTKSINLIQWTWRGSGITFTRQDHKSQNIGKLNNLKGFESKYTKRPKDDSQNMTGTFKKKMKLKYLYNVIPTNSNLIFFNSRFMYCLLILLYISKWFPAYKYIWWWWL